MVEIQYKKLHHAAVDPAKAEEGSVGFDLVAISKTETEDYIEYGTGLAFEILMGYVGLLFARSSISNTGHSLCNAVGVIDPSYRGEVKFRMRYAHGKKQYEPGDRVGQLLILPSPIITFKKATQLSETVRDAGGFGSTGK